MNAIATLRFNVKMQAVLFSLHKHELEIIHELNYQM